LPQKSKMMNPVKIAIGVGAAALWFFLSKGKTLKESADNINVSLLNLPKIHKIDLSGLKIAVDLKVDNPAKARVLVKLPSIRLFYKGKMVASTAVNDRTYTIEPVSTGKISDIMIEASYLNLLTTAPSIVTDFLANRANVINNLGFDVLAEVNGIPLKVQKIS
jgi:hypothetical protein